MSNKLITHYMLHFFNNKIQHIVTFRGLGLLKFFYQFISPSLLILMHLKVLEKKLRKIIFQQIKSTCVTTYFI